MQAADDSKRSDSPVEHSALSEIVSLVLVFVMSHTTLVLAGVSSYISGNISFPFFYCKERYCDCVSPGIFPSSIQEKSSAVL